MASTISFSVAPFEGRFWYVHECNTGIVLHEQPRPR
jgi:hypothetical protein